VLTPDVVRDTIYLMNYKKTVLGNGLRIITVPMKDTQSAIGMVLVETGSDYEDKNINGLSHFLEHMCFKETTNRSGEQIKNEIDGLGASANAFTSNEFTGYYAKANHKKIGKIIDFVSDMYLNPTFPEKDINIERGVIIEEINMYEDLPQQTVVWDLWPKLLYGGTSLGRTVIGPKENIRKLERQDFVDYHSKHYVTGKTTVVVAGNIDQAKVLKQVKVIFGELPQEKIAKKDKFKFSQRSPKLVIKHKKTDQAHIVLGFRAFNMYDKRNIILKVAGTVLGQGFSSRLFHRMRDELGMCYYTKAVLDEMTDRGSFYVRSGVGNKRAYEAVEVIIEEYQKLLNEEIGEKELKKAKEYMIGHISTGLETSEDLAQYFGFQELLHEEILKPSEVIKKIRAVTAKDIQKVLTQVMKKENLNLAIIGPFTKKDEVRFKKLLKI
jgi:predicted Zn-dependent peptidase